MFNICAIIHKWMENYLCIENLSIKIQYLNTKFRHVLNHINNMGKFITFFSTHFSLMLFSPATRGFRCFVWVHCIMMLLFRKTFISCLKGHRYKSSRNTGCLPPPALILTFIQSFLPRSMKRWHSPEVEHPFNIIKLGKSESWDLKFE